MATKIQETDLRSVSRDSDRCITTVYLAEESRYTAATKWLVFGAATLRLKGPLNTLDGYLAKGATDIEHDSAYVVSLPLIGVKLELLHSHSMFLDGWIAPRSLDNFHVPLPGYDPLSHPDTVICEREHCDPHPIVPEGFYLPSTNKDLYKYVEGRKVSIQISPVWENQK